MQMNARTLLLTVSSLRLLVFLTALTAFTAISFSSSFSSAGLLSAQEPVTNEVGVSQAEPAHVGGEANLKLPDLSQVEFIGGLSGRTLLFGGLVVCALGLAFGFKMYQDLRNLPVHQSMLEISDLIYETCKTYLQRQGLFIGLLWIGIGAVIVFYYSFLLNFENQRVAIIVLFSIVGILGSYGVAWFGIRVNTFANSTHRLCKSSRSALSDL